MIQHDTLLLRKVVKLTRDIFTDVPLLDRPAYPAKKAMLNGWPDFIIAACRLYPVRYLNREDAINLIERVEEFSPETATVLKTLVTRENENEHTYYNRVSMSPFGRAVLWLIMLERLSINIDKQEALKLLKWLPDMYPSYIINKYGFGPSESFNLSVYNQPI